MDGLEDGGMAGQRGFCLALSRAMVRDREAQTSGRARAVLVVEHCRVPYIAGLRVILQTRFGLYFRLRLHVDSLHPQPDHSSSPRKSATDLPILRSPLSARRQLLQPVRSEVDAGFQSGRKALRKPKTGVAGFNDNAAVKKNYRVSFLILS
jgi:hypothetical protein